ncbi:MAG: nicotinate-nucleotide--dimethylbenzimidazole phosphoribosyltransferase [Myxococcales bacterium]|nr:nicotinate-nucleotide--dimethylbenzimidazole phosphoribosyltransferase [Myxococcales bacterium]
MSAVVAHLVESIGPASAAMAAARAADGPLAAWLAAARHARTPALARRTVVCVLADHGVVATGGALGAEHPTAIAATTIARGEAALARAAAAASAALVLIDAGVAAAGALPPAVISVARGPSGDLAEGAALTPVEVIAALEAGVAIATALAEGGLDLLAVGALGAGGDLAAAAVIAALTGGGAELAAADGRALVAAGLALVPPGATALDVVAAVGGRDVAVVAGMILAAAATYVPVVLDGAVTLAAALVAARLAPDVRGYLACAHAGGGAAAAAARTALGLTPVLSVGLGSGEGTGAAMLLPVLAAAVTAG